MSFPLLREKQPAVFLILILTFGALLYFVTYPLYAVFRESAMNEPGKYVGLANYINFFCSEYFRQVFYNTLFISVIATGGAVIFGMIFAYGMTRTDLPLKSFFNDLPPYQRPTGTVFQHYALFPKGSGSFPARDDPVCRRWRRRRGIRKGEGSFLPELLSPLWNRDGKRRSNPRG
jgi:hypothetical protein